MGLITRIAGKRLVQSSTGDYNDGWGLSAITFLLYEDRWGRRSYEMRGPAGIAKSARFRKLDEPIQSWVRGGDLPPARLADAARDGGAPEPTQTRASLSKADREKLAKLLALLESAHEGEVINAAKAAAALLKSRHATWADVVGLGPSAP